jgi:hypothetical protein
VKHVLVAVVATKVLVPLALAASILAGALGHAAGASSPSRYAPFPGEEQGGSLNGPVRCLDYQPCWDGDN